jgi:hypothetical protein
VVKKNQQNSNNGRGNNKNADDYFDLIESHLAEMYLSQLGRGEKEPAEWQQLEGE